MVFLSQGHIYGDDDEHISETQLSHELIINNMEVITPNESPANSACDIPYEAIDHTNDNENVVSNDNAT